MAKPLLGEEEKRAVIEVLDSGILVKGENIRAFEAEFAKFIGVSHAIATSNGTTALHAALLAHGIGTGDEVITTTFSFIATANVIQMVGAKPIFVDIDENTLNLDVESIEKAITPRTKALLPVHLYGCASGMEIFFSLAKKYNLLLIEDACQAHGAEFMGKRAGSFGTGCFSFYPTKNMTTGEGGMITTNDDILALRLRKLIDHGSERRYVHDVLGFNYRMTEIAAAIGREQLKKLPFFLQRRKENAKYLSSKLKEVPGISLPPLDEGHAFHQYTIRVTPEYGMTRDMLQKILLENGIDSAVHYPLPIHQQKIYSEYRHLYFPVAELAAQEVLSLPIHPAIQKEDLDHIANIIIANIISKSMHGGSETGSEKNAY